MKHANKQLLYSQIPNILYLTMSTHRIEDTPQCDHYNGNSNHTNARFDATHGNSNAAAPQEAGTSQLTNDALLSKIGETYRWTCNTNTFVSAEFDSHTNPGSREPSLDAFQHDQRSFILASIDLALEILSTGDFSTTDEEELGPNNSSFFQELRQ